MSELTKSIARKFPNLELDLRQAEIQLTPEEFVGKNLKGSVFITFAAAITLVFILLKLELSLFLTLLILPGLFIFFIFLMNSPKVNAKKKVQDVDKEIVYAGRFLLIELSAGIPLYDSLKNVSRAYPKVGKHFHMITSRVEVGKPIEQALNEVIDLTPSENFRKLAWQIANSLKTGGDVAVGLKSIVHQISREQLIDLENYGKKLNPLVMFYLIIAVIAPSLGVSMLTLLSSFLGFSLSFGTLLWVAIGIALLQLMFLSVINSSRPGVEI